MIRECDMKTGLENKKSKAYNKNHGSVCKSKGEKYMADYIFVKGNLIDDKGTWTVRARVFDRRTGKYKQKSKSTGLSVAGNNKRKAEKAMEDILERWEEEANSDIDFNKDPTIEEQVQAWIDVKRNEVRENTLALYEMLAKKHITPLLGNIKVRDATRPMLQNYYKGLSANLSPSSLRKIRVVLNGAIHLAIEDNIIEKDITRFVRLPQQEIKEKQIIPEEQIDKLFNYAKEKGEPLFSATIFGLMYGLRRSEICGLRWSDIDMKAGTLTVTNTCTEFAGVNYELEKTKSPAGHRTLYLNAWTIDYLQQLKIKQIVNYYETDKVCRYPNGKPVMPHSLSHQITKMLTECGFEGVTLHGLRHTAATILVNRLPVKYVQAFLGHQKASTTLDIYAHVMNKDMITTSATMSDVFNFVEICSEKCSD